MMKIRVAALAAATAVAWASAAQAAISEDLKFCASLRSGKERLACYDAAARIESTQASRPVRNTSPTSPAVSQTPLPVMDAQAAIVTKAPPVAAANWQGFYIGANGGWAGATGSLNFDEKHKLGNWLGGGQFGYNAQSGQIVFGLIVDAQAADIGNRFDWSASPNFWDLSARNRIDVFGTARAKAGFDAGSFLIYGTAGLTWARNTYSHETKPIYMGYKPVIPSVLREDSQFHFGYAAGGGVEGRIAENWSLFGEYLYVNLHPQQYRISGNGMDLSHHIVRGGINFWFK
jgi:outer membrane immunogenic protein